MRIALAEPQSLVLETEQIKQSPADLIYVKKNELATVVLALAFIESGQYKWVSVDNGALIEKDGRIIKTLSLDSNLDFISSDVSDPLASPSNIDNTTTWQRKIDFNSAQYGLVLNSTFTVLVNQSLTIQDKIIETTLIEEQVDLIASEAHEYGHSHWVNQFWLHKETGKLLRSRQKIIPDGYYFDLTYVSRAVRL
ncbi:YjbF family lipoprotein [Paraglaciecola sp. 25GB23A]|uniref:YjbF family lipoprotein n=1 Tax=Paraglaciecola sp. 25GB23A TaxID=3156068 RepID=UPI0032AFA109